MIISEKRFEALIMGATPTEDERVQMHTWLASEYLEGTPVLQLYRSWQSYHHGQTQTESPVGIEEFTELLRDAYIDGDSVVAVVFDGIAYGVGLKVD